MKRVAVFPFLLVAAVALAQTAPEQIRFPAKGTAIKLGAETMYVVDADVPVLVLASPNGLVTISEETGPIRIRGRFADGTKVESRTFKGKQVFIIEASGVGAAEILVIPTGATKVSDVIRRTLDVDSGHAPQPPPDPPKPPEDDELMKSLKAAWLLEMATDKGKRPGLAALYRKAADWARTDMSLVKVKDLADKVSAERKKLLPNGELPNIHAVVAKRLDSTLPRTVGAVLDNTNRLKCSSEFDLIAGYLEKLP